MPEYVIRFGGRELTIRSDRPPTSDDVDEIVRRTALTARPDLLPVIPTEVLRSWGTDQKRGVDWRRHVAEVRANAKATPGERRWADEVSRREAAQGKAATAAPASAPAQPAPRTDKRQAASRQAPTISDTVVSLAPSMVNGRLVSEGPTVPLRATKRSSRAVTKAELESRRPAAASPLRQLLTGGARSMSGADTGAAVMAAGRALAPSLLAGLIPSQSVPDIAQRVGRIADDPSLGFIDAVAPDVAERIRERGGETDLGLLGLTNELAGMATDPLNVLPVGALAGRAGRVAHLLVPAAFGAPLAAGVAQAAGSPAESGFGMDSEATGRATAQALMAGMMLGAPLAKLAGEAQANSIGRQRRAADFQNAIDALLREDVGGTPVDTGPASLPTEAALARPAYRGNIWRRNRQIAEGAAPPATAGPRPGALARLADAEAEVRARSERRAATEQVMGGPAEVRSPDGAESYIIDAPEGALGSERRWRITPGAGEPPTVGGLFTRDVAEARARSLLASRATRPAPRVAEIPEARPRPTQAPKPAEVRVTQEVAPEPRAPERAPVAEQPEAPRAEVAPEPAGLDPYGDGEDTPFVQPATPAGNMDIVDVLRAEGRPVHVDRLAVLLGKNPAETAAEVMMAELSGRVVRAPGSRYVVPTHTIGQQQVYMDGMDAGGQPVWRGVHGEVVQTSARKAAVPIGAEPSSAPRQPEGKRKSRAVRSPIEEPASPTQPTTVEQAQPVAAERASDIPDDNPEMERFGEGGTGTTRTPGGREVGYHWEVVPLDDLAPSHTDALQPAANYPADLQPRDRAREATHEQVERIARELAPDMLGASPTTADGAPVIGPDNLVESGNGRVLALRRARAQYPERWAEYQRWLADHANEFGLRPAGADGVLVRVRDSVDGKTSLTGSERAAFAKEAGASTVARMSAAEVARLDGRRIVDDGTIGLYAGGDVNAAANIGFVRRFTAGVPKSELPEFLTSDGGLSVQGAQRVRSALLAAAYDDTIALERMLESPDDNTRLLGQAMLHAAGRLADLKLRIAAGELHPLDITGDITAAANALSNLRDTGLTVQEHLAQVHLFDADSPPVQAELLRLFDKYKRSAKRVGAILDAYVDTVEAAGHPGQLSMFGEHSAPTIEDALAAAERLAENAGHTGQLFDTEAVGGEAPRVAGDAALPGEMGSPPRELGAAQDVASTGQPASGGLGGVARGEADPRVTVARLRETGRPMSLQQIVARMGKLFGRAVRQGRNARWRTGRTIGQYSTRNANVQVKFHGDLDTVAHELAHYLDDQHFIVGEWRHADTSPFDAELGHYAAYGSDGPGKAYKRGEGVAEFLRALMVNPDEVARRSAEYGADSFLAHLQRQVPEPIMRAIRESGDMIRRWAWGSPTERVLSNIQTESGASEPWWSRVARWWSEGDTFRTTGADRAVADWLNYLWPVEKATRRARELRGVGDLLPSQNPIVLMRQWAGIAGKWQDILEHGPTDANRRPVLPGGVKWLSEPLDQSSYQAMLEDRRALAAYLDAWRVSERTALEMERAWQVIARIPADSPKRAAAITRLLARARQRGARMAGWGGGIESDYHLATLHLWDLEENPERAARVFEAAQRCRRWADAVLQYMVDMGRISAGEARRMRASDEFYADMHRVMGDDDPWLSRQANSRAIGRDVRTEHRFGGSTRELMDPVANLVTNTLRRIREADRNAAVARFVDLLESPREMYQGPPAPLSDIGYEVARPGPNTITVYRRGKATYWQFEKGVYQSLMAWGDTMPSNILTRMADVMRAGVTMAPPFRVRNLARDAVQRALISEHGSKPWEFATGTPEERAELARAGGTFSGHYMVDPEAYLALQERMMRDMAGDRSQILAAPGRAWRWWEGVGEAGERVGRVPEYRRAKRAALGKGLPEHEAQLYAAYEARRLMDFAAGGRKTRQLGRYVPFLNAATVGLSRVAGAAATHPGRFLARWIAYVLTPTLLVHLWNARQGDLDELREQPDYLRDMFWNVKLGANTWLRVPRPWEAGVMAGAVERAIDKAQGVKGAFDGYAGQVAKALMPVDESALVGGPLRGLVEAYVNYDTFRERPIVPTHEADLAWELRSGKRFASRLAQVLGNATHIDPRKIDHIISAQLGHVGTLAEHASDIGRKDRPVGRAFGLNDATGLFVQSPGRNSRSVTEYNRMARQYQLGGTASAKALRALLDTTDTAPTEQARDESKARAREMARRLMPSVAARAAAKAKAAARRPPK